MYKDMYEQDRRIMIRFSFPGTWWLVFPNCYISLVMFLLLPRPSGHLQVVGIVIGEYLALAKISLAKADLIFCFPRPEGRCNLFNLLNLTCSRRATEAVRFYPQ